MANQYLIVQRSLTRYAFDDPSVTFFGIMLHPGPGESTYLDIYSDRPCWRPLLDSQPPFLHLASEVHVCDTHRSIKWFPGKAPVSIPREATHRDETLVHVEMPFADYGIYDELLKDSQKFLVPENIATAKVFGDPLFYRKPTHVRPIRLAGQEVTVETIQPTAHSDGSTEQPMLYERGIPVMPIALPFHVNLLAVLPDPVPEAIAEDVARHFD